MIAVNQRSATHTQTHVRGEAGEAPTAPHNANASPRRMENDFHHEDEVVVLAAAAAGQDIVNGLDVDVASINATLDRRTKQLGRKNRKLLPRSRPATPHGLRRPAGTGKQQYRNVSLLDGDTNFLEDTGLTVDLFQALYQRMLPALTAPRVTANGPKKRYIARTWAPMTRLYIVLRWLRTMDSYRRIAKDMGGSAATVSREIWDTIPKLYVVLRNDIHLPTQQQVAGMPLVFTASGAIDCTTHLRNRVHPWSTEYYRGDKHAHFITAQLICSLEGKMWDVALGPGHNNDQNMLHITEAEQTILHQLATRLLADKGYTSDAVVRPDDLNDPELCERHAAYRSVVEQAFALVHLYAAATLKFRASPELQEMVLIIIYALVASKIQIVPLRTL